MSRNSAFAVVVLVLTVVAVLGWMRPVRTVTIPSPTDAMDAKAAEARHWHMVADSAMVRAAWWQAVAETAHNERINTPGHMERAERALRSADLDSLHAVLFGPVR